MKNVKMKPLSRLSMALGTLGLLVTLINCSSDKNNSTTPSTTGVITGFGSVFVNGVEYDTTNASITQEDIASSEDALSVGMVVTVKGSVNADGTTGSATSISYEDIVEGIVLGNTIAADGMLDVMGQTVTVNGDTIFESKVAAITQLSEIVAGNVVEISGYTSGDGSIFATRIEVKSEAYVSGEEIEVKGIIKAGVTATEFMIGTLTIDYATAVLDDLPATLVAGTYVEAKGIAGIDIPSKTMVAWKVELENPDTDDSEGSEVEIEGVVTNIVSATEFELNGRPVIHNGNTEFEHGTAAEIVLGSRLEAEGSIDASGKLLAKEIEFKIDATIAVEAYIDAIDLVNNTVTVFGKTFQVDNFTTMEDDSMTDIRYFSLSDLAASDRVKLRAYINAETGSLIATRLIRRDDDASDLELQGPVDADVAANATTLTMFGLTVDLATNGLTILATSAGNIVEFKGDFSGSQFVANSIE